MSARCRSETWAMSPYAEGTYAPCAARLDAAAEMPLASRQSPAKRPRQPTRLPMGRPSLRRRFDSSRRSPVVRTHLLEIVRGVESDCERAQIFWQRVITRTMVWKAFTRCAETVKSRTRSNSTDVATAADPRAVAPAECCSVCTIAHELKSKSRCTGGDRGPPARRQNAVSSSGTPPKPSARPSPGSGSADSTPSACDRSSALASAADSGRRDASAAPAPRSLPRP